MGPIESPAVTGLTGLALLTWLGGWLVVAGVYSETAASLLLTLGIAAWFLHGVRSGPLPAGNGSTLPRRRDVLAIILCIVALGLALLRVVGDLALGSLSLCDDLPTYLHFPRMLLESGSFIEPFNFRRLGSLGAAPLLQGFLWRSFTAAAPLETDALAAGSLRARCAAGGLDEPDSELHARAPADGRRSRAVAVDAHPVECHLAGRGPPGGARLGPRRRLVV